MEDLALSPEADGPYEYDSSADEFYEQIEAPKFVDLTEKDPVRVDDRYWFCSRVGCDQKHEEELDSEEVYKNFVIRVMAARSPNLRLQKALSRRGAPMAKCPLSAPPKSSRPPISRLGLLSTSVAKRLDGFKAKCSEQGPTVSSTPFAKKASAVAAKYMTTPRNRNIVPKQDQFRSVQNPKGAGLGIGEGRSRVAKALVFQSPKKAVKLKASLELKTPVRRVCERLKKLELDEESRKKRVLGYSPKSLSASKPKASSRPWHVEGSGRGEKSRKRKGKDMSQACENLDKAEDHTNDVLSKNPENGVVEEINAAECFEESSSEPGLGIEQVDANARGPDENQVSENHGQVESHEVPQDAETVENQVSGSPSEVEKKEVSHEAQDEEQDAEGDDKENESAPDQNRCKFSAVNEETHSPGRKVLGPEKTCKRILKVTRSTMTLKDVVAADAQVLKYNKPKPTNPKPFRLRTDERSILKEACSEKKVRCVTPLCRNENALQNGKCQEEIIFKSNTDRGSETKSACKKITKLQSKQDKQVHEKPNLTKVQKPSTVSSPLEHGKAVAAKKPEKPKSILSSGKRKNVTPNRDTTTRKPTVSFLIPGEKTPEISCVKEADKVSGTKSPARLRSLTRTTTTQKAAGVGCLHRAKSSTTWRLP
ncbi:hypothetical protein QQ045_013421 [Rhodiola kirilowii]